MRIYIAGKVSGLPQGDVFVKFNVAAYQLACKGYEVVNPLKFCSSHWSWAKCMRICIREMLKCDAIYLLPDWQESRGAMLEYYIAKEIGMKSIYASPTKYAADYKWEWTCVFIDADEEKKCEKCMYGVSWDDVCDDYHQCYPDSRPDKRNGYYNLVLKPLNINSNEEI